MENKLLNLELELINLSFDKEKTKEILEEYKKYLKGGKSLKYKVDATKEKIFSLHYEKKIGTTKAVEMFGASYKRN